MARTFSAPRISGLMCDSLGDLKAWLEAAPMPTLRNDPSFFPARDKQLPKLQTGDTALVPRSDRLLDRIETIERMADAKPELVRTVAGGLADVPAYLSGSPVAMRRRSKQESKAPLSIVVDTMCAGGLSPEHVEARGVAVLALLRKLQAEGYPITLYLLGAGRVAASTRDCQPVLVAMEAAPLDIARTCWAMSSTGYCRTLMFTAQTRLAGMTRYQDSNYWGPNEDYAPILTAAGLDPSATILVPYLHLGTAFKSDKQAAAWVNEQYAAAVAMAHPLL